MTTEKAGRFLAPDELPELHYVFDERGAYHCDIANKAIMVKKDDQHDDIVEFAGKLGTVQPHQYNTMINDVDEQKAVEIFKEEGYTVVKADERDFIELQHELDLLETISGGEHKKYDSGP